MTTTTTHRHGCPRPGWTTEPATAIRTITIARCTGCGAVELRIRPPANPMEGRGSRGPLGRAPIEAESSGRWSA